MLTGDLKSRIDQIWNAFWSGGIAIPEQRRIAAILDQAGALRTQRRDALAQLDNLAQSIFLDMFGGSGRQLKGLA